MEMTMAEKVLARTSGRDAVEPGEFVTAAIDTLMVADMSFYDSYELMIEHGCSKIWDPDRMVVIMDHQFPAQDMAQAEKHRKIREWVKKHGIRNFYDGGVGICHQVMVEKGHVLPGDLIVGGDSHTTTYGALGAASSGIGHSDIAYVMAKGSLWFMVPETIQFILRGTLPKGTSAKDIILRIAGDYSTDVAQYKSIEFLGPVAEELSIDARMTICNMALEIGAKFAFFKADNKTVGYLKQRTNKQVKSFGPDSGANYEAVYEIDVSSLEPQVACPHEVDNVKPVGEVEGVTVQQAFIGSCTNARIEDLERAAAILKGRKVHHETRLIVMPASREVYIQVSKSGALQALLEAGAMLGPPVCGPCGGLNNGILAKNETAICSTNRNFKGRMGNPESFVFLASPETVAASAIEGKIADPRKYIRD
ncbi:MAG: 3-isopropylmalate dehydratase large subunit [Deltaproteobacteria bacterium]|nr:3-isopropylmalate dehydratase large subunit [Deltaproteobacteria bacterium]